jgi:hypothetical protein
MNDNNKSASVFTQYIAESLKEERREPAAPPTEEKLAGRKRPGTNPKILLMDLLANGPVPKTTIMERGTAHGLTEKQLRRAREKMNISTFKEVGPEHGRWFWALPEWTPPLPKWP